MKYVQHCRSIDRHDKNILYIKYVNEESGMQHKIPFAVTSYQDEAIALWNAFDELSQESKQATLEMLLNLNK
jgi:hypothetical protein